MKEDILKLFVHCVGYRVDETTFTGSVNNREANRRRVCCSLAHCPAKQMLSWHEMKHKSLSRLSFDSLEKDQAEVIGIRQWTKAQASHFVKSRFISVTII
jgi:hypothetical protein